MYYQRDDPYSFPKVSTLAANLGCSERTTRRAIGELKAAQLLIVMPVSGSVSRYTIAEPIAPTPAKNDVGPRTEAPGGSGQKRQGGPVKNDRGPRTEAPPHIDSRDLDPGLRSKDDSSSAIARTGREPAVAAEQPSNGEESEGATTRRPAIQGRHPAQQPSATEETACIEALRQRGLSRELAEQAAQRHSYASLRQILTLYDREYQAGTLQKPMAALRGMIARPADWGLERDQAGVWQMPAAGKVPPKSPGGKHAKRSGFRSD
jgi:hypothetical protein